MKWIPLKTSILFFAVLSALFGCGPAKFIPQENPDPPAPFYLPEKIQVALVLGSGGVRGMAHVGVLEEFEKAGIPIDIIVGCSAGSIVGALYADNPDAAAIKRAVWAIKTDSLLEIDIWNCRYGLSQGYSMAKVLDQHLEAETFDQLKLPLIVVASDLHSGELVPMGSGDLVSAVRASCSIPFVFVPCERNGRVLVDGGVINPVPVKVAYDLGADIVIAVDLCELLNKTCPTNLFEMFTRSAEIAFMWQNEACSRSADVIIRPKTCDVGTFNDDLKSVIYEAGKYAAREQIPHIKELLSSLPERDCHPKFRQVQPICYTPQICLEEEEEVEKLSQAASLNQSTYENLAID